jgi:hypothetical protein
MPGRCPAGVPNGVLKAQMTTLILINYILVYFDINEREFTWVFVRETMLLRGNARSKWRNYTR